MAVSFDEFKQLRAKGLSIDQITRFDKQETMRKDPSMQGGANAPAVKQANKEVATAQFNDSPIGDIGRTVKSVVDPTKYLANSAMFGIPGITSELLSGGKMVNPLTHGLRVTEGGTNIFDSKDLSEGQKLSLNIGSMLVPGEGLAKITGLEKQLGNVMKFRKPENVAKLADEVDNSLMLAHEKVTKNFGPEYDRIIGKSQKKINLSDPVKNLISESDSLLQNPEFLKTTGAKKVMKMVEDAKNNKSLSSISAKEADQLQKSIKNIPSIKTKLEKGYKTGFHNVDWTNEERIALKFSNDIKSKVIEGHEELSNLNKNYGDFMNSYKQIRGGFGIKKTEGLMRNYHDETKVPERLKIEIRKVLPKDKIDKIVNYNKSQRFSETLKKLGLFGLGAAGYGEIKHVLP